MSDLTHGEVVSENKKQRFSKKAAHVKILPPSSSGRALPQMKDKKTCRMIICQESTKSLSPVSNGPQVHHSENENVTNILQRWAKLATNIYISYIQGGFFTVPP